MRLASCFTKGCACISILRNSSCKEHGKSGCCAWPQPHLLRRRRTSTRASQPLRSTAPGRRKAPNSKSGHWVNSVFRSNFRGFTNTKRRRVQPRTRVKGAEEECQITLRFTGGKLVVTQTGICGFGHNVRAAGTYKKVSARKPKFGSD